MKKLSMWLVILSMLAAMAPSYTAIAEKTWINIEAEDGVYSKEFSVYENGAASGGKGIYIGKPEDQVEDKTPGADWTFDIPEAGKYDVWMVALIPNQSYLSRFKLGFNGEDPQYYVNNQTSVNPYLDGAGIDPTPSLPVYQLDHGFGSGYYVGSLCWIKVAENKDFSAGTNTLHYEIERRQIDPGTYVSSVDCIRIVPSEWNWMAKPDLSVPEPSVQPEPEPEIKVFEQEENGLIWMEAEEAYAPDFSILNVSADRGIPSGGEFIGIGAARSDTDRLSAKFKFNVEDSGSYDIWMLAQEPNKAHLSRYMTSVDDEALHYINDIWGGYLIENSPSVFQGYVAGGWFGNYWVRVEAGKSLDVGEHSFEFAINERAIGGDMFVTTLDCVAVVPSSWNWIPDATSEKAKPPIGRYAWIELENSNEPTRFHKTIRGTTGGSETIDWADIISNKGAISADGIVLDGNEKLSYDFYLTNSGNYDIYYLGTRTDVTHLSRLWWGIDNSDIFVDPDNHTNHLSATGEDVSAEMFKIGEHGLYWQRMAANKPLNAGEHTLYLEYVNRQIAPEHYMRADCVIIVPSEWNWKMPETAQEPAKTAVELDALEQFYTLQDTYADGVSGNIENLNVRGSGGSKFVYESKSPDIISNDGIVTHPNIGEGMVRGALGFTANKEFNQSNGGYAYRYVSGETVLRFVVLESAKIEYSGFDVKYADGAPISGELVSGAQINASVSIKTNDIENADGAMIALAVYKNGALVKITGNEVVLGSDYQTLSTGLFLPEDSDMSGYKVKAFLWDGISTANPYCGALEY